MAKRAFDLLGAGLALLLLAPLMAAIAQTSPEAKRRLADFLEGRAAKMVHQK